MRKKIVGPESVGDAADVGAFLRADEEEAPRIVGSDATLEDEVYGATLRPRTFEDYVGQTQVVENLRIAIDAATRARRAARARPVLRPARPGQDDARARDRRASWARTLRLDLAARRWKSPTTWSAS